ncbi:ABC transporter permease [Arachidicoccus ginsenosidivorans]|jgi:predicted permease|uniref:FtsX-like permease family protein n=1 Tax=Arachidicoccus ginsenosidivorans TaxID=496057 RepID=A0A5B8VJF4_9BACT|nr:ABC transporter permease [Arachidicoccus ginsenosidivorans]QEC71439.1 FtsX-like permease family protein [Arachidicoccus ginsenosidivorans]
MFKRFLITTWRNFKKSRAFSLLNITGLAIGIACAGIILLWVEYYTTFNHSVKDLSRVYRMENAQVYGKDTYTFPVMPLGIRDELLNNFPEVETAVRYIDAGINVSLENKNFAEQAAYADPEFLNMFSYNVIRGDANRALSAPDGVALSAKVAKAYFGSVDVIGKMLQIDKQPYQINAVFKDPPENMTFANAKIILPYSVYYNQNKQYDAWNNNMTEAWVLLKPGASAKKVNAALAGLAKSHGQLSYTYFMYPMERIAMHGNFSGTKEATGGTVKMVRMFALIAFIILLIACINFMNLSTARSEKRAREIGLRKVMGSSRRGLILRLLSEAVLMSFAAVVIALLLIAACLPLFNGLIGLHLQMNLRSLKHIGFVCGLGIFSGLLAGIYPAFYLSSFNPIAALKGNGLKAGGASFIRKILVVLQFSVSAIIIVAIFVIYHQIQHMRTRDLGYNKNNVVYLTASDKLSESFPALKQALMATGKVASVSLGSHTPLEMNNNGGGLKWKGKQENEDVLITKVRTDNNYLNTFNIPLVAGRGFKSNPDLDSNDIIINETLASLMGKEGRVGGLIYYGQHGALTIVGITKDFIYNNISATHPAPLMFFNQPKATGLIFIRLQDEADLSGSLAALKSVFLKFDAAKAFDYHFMDKAFEATFQQQRFTGSLAIIFGGLAIVISCLGLFGLSAYMAEQRTREIGIRKVLGASVSSVIKLLTRDFIIMVFISCVIAFPIAYYLMDHWLMDFDYRINIHWYVFAVTALSVVIIAFVTVSSQAFKAGRLNPVKAIRSE